MSANVKLHYVLLYGAAPGELAAARSWVQDALSTGALTTLPIERFPLGETRAAQDAVQAGTVGKVVVIPN
jgi:hypothetical protein